MGQWDNVTVSFSSPGGLNKYKADIPYMYSFKTYGPVPADLDLSLRIGLSSVVQLR